MKIITPGKAKEPDLPWWSGMKITCHSCACVFELEPQDTVDFTLIPPHHGVTTCPNQSCHERVAFDGPTE